MVVANNEINETKNAGKLTTISMAMVMQRYDAGRIARWSTSRDSLEATGCSHRASVCAVLPRQTPWLTNSNKTHKTLTKHNFYLATIMLFTSIKLLIFVTRKGPSTHVIDATSFVTMWDAKIQKDAISYISRVNLTHYLGNLTLLGNQFWDLSSASLTNLQYLFSRSKTGTFVRAAHKNYCTRGVCSKTAIKTKY